MDLLEQCELDDEKLMGKSSRQRGPKVGERGRGERNQVRGGGIRATCLKGPKRKCQKKSVRERKMEGGDRQVGRCLELTPTESTQDVIEKEKGGGGGREGGQWPGANPQKKQKGGKKKKKGGGGGRWLGEKEKNQKKTQRKDPTPQGDSCQAVSLAPSVLSFFLSISLSFSLSPTPIRPLDFPRQHITPSITLLHPPHFTSPSPPFFFSPHTSTSIPHSRAKLAGTLKEYVRDSTGQLSAALEGP